ncbi:MAG TPA: hypothetical protein VLR26_17555 [Frankiaceae bacterium]|nr:hypothetical protein [Frankiaceae bacterium]
MRSRRLLLAPLLLAALAPLAVGCSSNSSSNGATSSNVVVPPVSKADVHSVDWRNASYSVACVDLGGPADQQVPVTLADGAGSTAPVTWFGSPPVRLDVAVKSVSYGDLTGDGRDEAVVDLTCTPAGSNGVAQELQVFAPGSELLGTPSLRNATGSGFAPAIKTLAVANGHLSGTALAWARTDPHCCPSQSFPFTFTWNAERATFDQS